MSDDNVVAIDPRSWGAERKKGTLNKTTRLLKHAILLAGEKAGNKIADAATEDREGLVSYLTWLAVKHPTVFAALLGRVLPYTIRESAEDMRGFHYNNIDEVRAALAERGLTLPVEIENAYRQHSTEIKVTEKTTTTVRLNDER